jgi:hypothetical protein
VTGIGEGAVAGGPVDEPFAGGILEPADRLADGRLRAAKLAGGPGKASLRRDGDEHAQVLKGHVSRLRLDENSPKVYAGADLEAIAPPLIRT